jgi:hypothetical protein
LATSRALEQVIRKLSSPNCDASKVDEMDIDIGLLAGSSTQPYAVLQPYHCKDMQTATKALISSFVAQYEGQ